MHDGDDAVTQRTEVSYCDPYLPYTVGFGCGQRAGLVAPYWAEKYEREASKFWDQFYKVSEDRFFKDRHWTQREFNELLELCTTEKLPDGGEVPVLVELGCGVGNTIFPLIEDGIQAYVYAMDFSATAIDVLKRHELYDESRVKAFVCDITDALTWPEEIRSGSVDVVTLIFVLSAISPEKMGDVVRKVWEVLKPGGMVLFRDYARGDMAHARFKRDSGVRKKLAPNFFVRGDGTRAYFFNTEESATRWRKGGFEVLENVLVEKTVRNRKEGKEMHRRWLQAKFRKR